MSSAAELFLGIIAASVLVMALVQVGVVVTSLRLMRRVEQLSRQIEEDVRPLIVRLTEVADEAMRTASLASRQVERLDQLFGSLGARLDDTLRMAQQVVRGPAGRGLAILTGVRAAFSALRGIQETSRRRRNARPRLDDEESLFIG